MVLEQRALWNQHHWLQVVQQCVRGHEASGGDIRVQPIAIASGRSEISMEFFQSALPSACRRDWLYSFDLKDVYLQVLVSSFLVSPFVCLMRRFFPFGGCFGFSSAPMVHLFDSWSAFTGTRSLLAMSSGRVVSFAFPERHASSRIHDSTLCTCLS